MRGFCTFFGHGSEIILAKILFIKTVKQENIQGGEHVLIIVLTTQMAHCIVQFNTVFIQV